MITIDIKIAGRRVAGAIITPTGGTVGGEPAFDAYQVEAVETAAPHLGMDNDFRSVFLVKDHLREQTVWALVRKAAQLAEVNRSSGEFDIPPREVAEA